MSRAPGGAPEHDIFLQDKLIDIQHDKLIDVLKKLNVLINTLIGAHLSGRFAALIALSVINTLQMCVDDAKISAIFQRHKDELTRYIAR